MEDNRTAMGFLPLDDVRMSTHNVGRATSHQPSRPAALCFIHLVVVFIATVNHHNDPFTIPERCLEFPFKYRTMGRQPGHARFIGSGNSFREITDTENRHADTLALDPKRAAGGSFIFARTEASNPGLAERGDPFCDSFRPGIGGVVVGQRNGIHSS
jgi:hypothetical protein